MTVDIAMLSEAQRKCFRRSSELGCICDHHRTRAALIAKGLAVQPSDTYLRALDWTPAGLEARALLLKDICDVG